MNEIERIYSADGFVRSIEWPDPTPEMLDTILFDTIWRVIKTWDINVPHAYSGYMGATGNHARAIYAAIAAMRGEPVAMMGAKEISAAALLAACESDPADPEHPDTICITTGDLETIVRCAVENWVEGRPTPPASGKD